MSVFHIYILFEFWKNKYPFLEIMPFSCLVLIRMFMRVSLTPIILATWKRNQISIQENWIDLRNVEENKKHRINNQIIKIQNAKYRNMIWNKIADRLKSVFI